MADQLLLPVSVTSKPDIIRLLREVDGIEAFMQQARVRQAGKSVPPPRTSQLLENMAQVNGLNLLQDAERQKIKSGLKAILAKAPVLHMSFASNPGVQFMESITAWFRQEIDPSILIEVGLQPGIAAGFTLRTKSKYFDFSLRKTLGSKEGSLLEAMRSKTDVGALS